MNRSVRVGLIALALAGAAGCAAVWVATGAAGGYAISKDSIRNHFDLPPAVIFRESRGVLREEGLITVEDESHGLLKAEVEGANVTVTVKRISEKTTQLQVKARNDWLMPKIDVAQALYNQILARLQ
jgi:hypothetical protein